MLKKSFISENLGIGGFLVLAVAVWLFLSVFFVPMAEATLGDITGHMDNFQDSMILDEPPVVQTLSMNDGDNIMILDSGSPISISVAGYDEGYWHLGLLNSSGDVIGWAKNSIKEYDGYEGWLLGEYSSLLGANTRPTDAVLVYDKLDNGWYITDDGDGGNAVGSNLDLAEGDLFFWTDEIYFDGTPGNMNAFSPYGTIPYARIPEMVVVIPEPATLFVLCIGGLLLTKKCLN
jgi:hypothetical protein